MEAPKPATVAWAALASGIAVYEVMCPRGETLSEGVDRALERPYGRIAALGGIAVTAAHLANLIPQRYDPFSRILRFKDNMGDMVDDALDCWGQDEY